METWIKWEPDPRLEKEIYLIKSIDTNDSYTLLDVISSENTKEKYIKFDYKNYVVARREADEGKRLQTWEYLCTIDKPKWPLFIIDNSKLKQWFIKESQITDKIFINKIQHHVFLTDTIVDILSIAPPEITISDTEFESGDYY